MFEVTTDVMPESFKEIRVKKLNYSQKQMAEALGLSLASVQKIEQGDTIPSYYVLMKLSELTGIDFRITKRKKHPLYISKVGANQ